MKKGFAQIVITIDVCRNNRKRDCTWLSDHWGTQILNGRERLGFSTRVSFHNIIGRLRKHGGRTIELFRVWEWLEVTRGEMGFWAQIQILGERSNFGYKASWLAVARLIDRVDWRPQKVRSRAGHAAGTLAFAWDRIFHFSTIKVKINSLRTPLICDVSLYFQKMI